METGLLNYAEKLAGGKLYVFSRQEADAGNSRYFAPLKEAKELGGANSFSKAMGC